MLKLLNYYWATSTYWILLLPTWNNILQKIWAIFQVVTTYLLTISSWESMQRLRIKRTVKNQELVHFLAVRRNRIACISTLPKLNLTKLPLLKAGQLDTSPKVYLALPCDRELCWEVSQLSREYSQWKRDDIVIQKFLYFLLLLSQPTKLSGMPLVGI